MHEMLARRDELAERGKRARNDEIEQRPWPPGLDAAFVHLHVR
jgi:hypothetical protein